MSALASQIERRLEDEADIHVAVEEQGDRIILSGLVTTDEERTLAIETAESLASGHRIEDNLEVGGVLPAEVGGHELSEMETSAFPGATVGFEEESLEAGDFQDQQGLQEAWVASGPTSAIDDDLVSEGDEVYVPPTDPVGTNREVIGGTQGTSMDSIEVARSSDGKLGDEAIADAIRRELREDAATTALEIEVEVYDGVARLRGRVADLDDAESAEEVAARVPGVIEVREELSVATMEER